MLRQTYLNRHGQGFTESNTSVLRLGTVPTLILSGFVVIHNHDSWPMTLSLDKFQYFDTISDSIAEELASGGKVLGKG